MALTQSQGQPLTPFGRRPGSACSSLAVSSRRYAFLTRRADRVRANTILKIGNLISKSETVKKVI